MSEWRRASQCTASNCVEVNVGQGGVRVRDSKTGKVLGFTVDEWRAFVAGVKDGEFEL